MNRIKTFLLKKDGFSIVEALVAMGMIAVGMLAMVEVSEIQSKDQQRVAIWSNVDQVTSNIHTILQNDQGCANTVLRNTVTSPANINNNINVIFDGSNNRVYGVGDSFPQQGFTIAAITAVPFQGYGYPNAGPNGEYAFNVRIDFQIDSQAKINAMRNLVSRTLPEPIYVHVENNAGVYEAVECLSAMGRLLAEMKRDACESLGGEFGVVDPNEPRVWCTLPGSDRTNRIAADDPESAAVGTPNYKRFTVARDQGINTSTNGEANFFNNASYARYLVADSSRTGGTQTVQSSLTFDDGGGSNGNGVVVNGMRGSFTNLADLQDSVPNTSWLAANFINLMRQGDSSAICAPGENPVITSNNPTGITCTTTAELQCAPGEYLQGIRVDGSALCLPIVSPDTCGEGETGDLVMNGGTLEIRCNTCSSRSGRWENVSSQAEGACGCDGSFQQLQICVTRCGGRCLDRAGNEVITEGATRINVGSCIRPAGCEVDRGQSPDIDSGSCSYACFAGRFEGHCNCCPANYPNTSSRPGCCESDSGALLCL